MTLYDDTNGQSLVISPNDIRRCLPPQFTVGDTVPITLAFLQRNPQPLNTGQPVFNYLDFSASGVVLAVGPGGIHPSASNSLYPASTVAIVTDVVGTSTNPAIQVLNLAQSPTASVSIWTAQSAAAVTVTSLSGTVTQRVAIPAGTYGGTFTLTTNSLTTAPIPFAA